MTMTLSEKSVCPRFVQINKGICPVCAGTLDDGGYCPACHIVPALDPEYQQWLNDRATTIPTQHDTQSSDHSTSGDSDHGGGGALTLHIPVKMSIEAASYWLGRAAKLCPGQTIQPEFV